MINTLFAVCVEYEFMRTGGLTGFQTVFRPWLSLAFVLLSGCGGTKNSSPAPMVTAENTKSFRAVLNSRLLLTGTLDSVDATEIRVPKTPDSQIQIRWMVEDGTEVQKGDRILEFDNTSFIETAEKKKIELDGARRDLDQQKARTEANLIEAELSFEKTRIQQEKAALLAGIPKTLISRREFQDHQMALRRAEADHEKARVDQETATKTEKLEIQIAEIKIRGIRRELRIAEDAIDALTVHAPQDGVISVAEHPWEGRKIKVGDSLWAGLTVMRMPNLDHMAVHARLFDVDDGRLRPGMSVSCILDTYPQDVFKGNIREITPIAQEVGVFSLRRAFDVNIDLKRSDPSKMRPGMSVRVEVPDSVPGTHLLVPRWAIETQDERAWVHLAGGGKKEVELGACSAQLCVIEAGLEEGVSLAQVSEGKT